MLKSRCISRLGLIFLGSFLCTLSTVHALDDKATITCSELASLTLSGARILTATEVAATAILPKHCLVVGVIEDNIKFEIKLPDVWNRKLYMGGHSGFGGNFRNVGIDDALKRGYATTQTDTGHVGTGQYADWALNNRKAQVNFAYRATHLTAIKVKNIVRKYYGNDIQYSYFHGCSGGGAAAMMISQRFPSDFDGIIVGAPAYNWTGVMGMDFVWNQQAMFPDPSNLSTPVISNSKLGLIKTAVLQNCDGADGLVDGLIDDPRNCTFDPTVDLVMCPDDVDSHNCFTTAQIAVLQKIYSGPSNSRGQLYPGFLPSGAEDEIVNWPRWIADGMSIPAPAIVGKPNGEYLFGQEFLRYFVYNDPTYGIHSFNFETDINDLFPTSRLLDATDTNLRPFKAQGGKMIIYHGWADAAIPPLGTIDYYEQLINTMGGEAKTNDFSRLFMVPGMAHCVGGTGPTPTFGDWLPVLEEWVEEGITPDQVIVSHVNPNQQVDRTRPLCPYPKVATYIGSGSIDDAANFICEER